jgi:hypothetical protein
MRRCSRCRISKEASAFYKSSNGHCKKCTIAAVREWRRRNPSVMRDTRLKAKYGITGPAYQALLLAQSSKCAICGSTDSKNAQCPRLVIDHDHVTNTIRGLLCHPCNTGIGQFRDSPELLALAAAYLRADPPTILPTPAPQCLICAANLQHLRCPAKYCSRGCAREAVRRKKNTARQLQAAKDKARDYQQRPDVKARRREWQRASRAAIKQPSE